MFLSVVFCLLFPFPYYENLNNPNEHVRLYMTMAIVEHGTFSIDHSVERFGWVNDRALANDHLYSGKAPGASYVGVPFYALAATFASLSGSELSRPTALRVLRLCAVTLPCLLFLVYFRRFFNEFSKDEWISDVFFFSYALGSMAYAYSLLFAGHQLAAVCLAGALIAFYRLSERIESQSSGLRKRSFFAGLLLGSAPAMEYPVALASLFFAIYAVILLRKHLSLLAFSLMGAGIPIVLVATFHTCAFGSPLAFPYDFIENPAFQALLDEGWHGSTYPQASRLRSMLFAPNFGIFFFTPILIFAPLGWIVMAQKWSELPERQKHLIWAVPAATITMILYLSSSALWRGGWTVAPRYLASIIPLLTLAALWGARPIFESWPRISTVAIGVLALISVVHSGTSGALYPHQPEPFDNPVYDLNFRLIWHGFAPHNALEFLGCSGFCTLVLLGIFAGIGALAMGLGPKRKPIVMAFHALLVISICALASVALSSLGGDSPAEARMWSLVTGTWEPVVQITNPQ